MKNKKIVFLIVFLIININCFSENNTNKLQEKLIEKKNDYFSFTDDFIFLGIINNYSIVYNKHYWGNNRMTGRIIIFENEEPIGSYGVINEKPIIKDKTIFFPDYEEKYGNTIS